MQVSSPQPLECLGQEVSRVPRKFLGALEPKETLLLSAFQNFSKSMEIPPFWAVANILSHPSLFPPGSGGIRCSVWPLPHVCLSRKLVVVVVGEASTPFHR